MSELEKMEKAQEASQAIGDFVEEFLKSKGIILATYHKHSKKTCDKDEWGWKCGWRIQQPILLHYDIQKLLAEYFNINLDDAEKEKQKILNDLRDARVRGDSVA